MTTPSTSSATPTATPTATATAPSVTPTATATATATATVSGSGSGSGIGGGGVKHVIVVMSGKGGVGKSTVACQIARAFHAANVKVGILDVDLCGPSVPKILGLNGKRVKEVNEKWVPVYMNEDKMEFPVISMAVLTDDNNAPVIWRGPRKSAIIKSFFEDVMWGNLDVLIIDTPPGTSDEHISVCEQLSRLNPDGAVIVTTPQAISVDDVRKEINFCMKLGMPVLGVFENLSGYVCPHCSTCTNIFSSEGGRILSEQYHVPFLGKIPIDPALCLCEETGEDPFTTTDPSSEEEPKKTIAEKSLQTVLKFTQDWVANGPKKFTPYLDPEVKEQ